MGEKIRRLDMHVNQVVIFKRFQGRSILANRSVLAVAVKRGSYFTSKPTVLDKPTYRVATGHDSGIDPMGPNNVFKS